MSKVPQKPPRGPKPPTPPAPPPKRLPVAIYITQQVKILCPFLAGNRTKMNKNLK